MREYYMHDLVSVIFAFSYFASIVLICAFGAMLVFSNVEVESIWQALVALSLLQYVLNFCVVKLTVVSSENICFKTHLFPISFKKDKIKIDGTMGCPTLVHVDSDERGEPINQYKLFFIRTNQCLRPWVIASGYREFEKEMDSIDQRN